MDSASVVYTHDGQCCQLAEISATKHESGPKKSQRPDKSGAEFSSNLVKSGRKEDELFFEVCS
jgi:hypothetical protein